MTEAVAGRPTPVGGVTATLVALLATLPTAAAAPGAATGVVLALLGGGVLAAAVPWLDHDDPRRQALASVALVPGGALTTFAALAVDGVGVLVAVTVGGVAVFAAGLGAAGYVTGDDLKRLLVGLLADAGALAVGAVGALAVHVGAATTLAASLGGLVGWLADLGTANAAAVVAMGAFETGALVAVCRRAARATPAEPLPGETDRVAAALTAVDDSLAGVVPWLELVALVATVVALAAPAVSVLAPLVSPEATALAGATRPLHVAAWTLAGLLGGYLLAARVAVALSRRSPTWVVRRSVRATGGVAGTLLVAAVLGVVPFAALVAAVMGPGSGEELVVEVAASAGAATVMLLAVLAVLVPPAATVAVLLVAVGGRFVPEQGAGAAIAAALLFGQALAAAAGGSVVGALLGPAAAFVVWDAGEHAASLGSHVGRAGGSRRAELVHVGAGLGVGALAVGIGVLAVPVAALVAGLASPAYAGAALVLVLVALLALVSLASG